MQLIQRPTTDQSTEQDAAGFLVLSRPFHVPFRKTEIFFFNQEEASL